MTLAANQPYFFPYLPYWQLIACADMFLIADDYAYMRKSWINRNRILVNGEPRFFRIRIRDASSFRMIGDTEILPPDRDLLKTLDMAYHKAPHFDEGFAVARAVLEYPDQNLVDFLEHSYRVICDYLGIDTPLMRTSALPGNNLYKKEFRIYDFCHRLGADTYVNAVGGQHLYHFDDFVREGLRLRFLRSCCEPYPQFGDSFTPGLSILDAMMFNSREQLQRLLGQYSFIDG